MRSIIDPEIATDSIEHLLTSRKLRLPNQTQRTVLENMRQMENEDLQDLAYLLNDRLQSEEPV